MIGHASTDHKAHSTPRYVAASRIAELALLVRRDSSPRFGMGDEELEEAPTNSCKKAREWVRHIMEALDLVVVTTGDDDGDEGGDEWRLDVETNGSPTAATLTTALGGHKTQSSIRSSPIGLLVRSG